MSKKELMEKNGELETSLEVKTNEIDQRNETEIGKHEADQYADHKQNENNNDYLEEEDDFGDFEEGEFQNDVNEDINDSEINISHNFSFNEDFDKQKKSIEKLILEIFPANNQGTNEIQKAIFQFSLNERCKDLYNRIAEQEPTLQQLKWKQTMIRRQLLLNLNIPIDLDDSKPMKTKNVISNIYDNSTTSEIHKPDMERLLKLVPEYKSLNIKDEKRRMFLKNTNVEFSDIYSKMQTIAFYESLDKDRSEELDVHLKQLTQIKQDLLKLLSCWLKNYEEIKADNELFSSYVENLVGNTQKMRRSNKHS